VSRTSKPDREVVAREAVEQYGERAIRGARKARQVEKRAAAGCRLGRALVWADRVANAHQDGVVLVLSYPGTRTPCRGLLEANGWGVAYYQITQAELDRGALLPGPYVVDDIRAADVIVIEGLDVPGIDRMASMRDFRDNVRSGASVVLYTGGLNYRYDLTAWSECDQATDVPVTTETAVRASVARRPTPGRTPGAGGGSGGSTAHMTDEEYDALVVAVRPGSCEERGRRAELERQPIGELIEPPPGWQEREVAAWHTRQAQLRRRRWLVIAAVAVATAVGGAIAHVAI